MFKRALTAMVSVLLMFSLIVIPSAEDVNADWNVKELSYRKNVTVYKLANHDESVYGIDLGKRDDKAKKVTFTVSKKGVIEPISWTSGYAVFAAEKPGKTVLTIKIKHKNGTSKKYKVNMTVKKYVSPINSIRIGKKTYKNKKLWKDLFMSHSYTNKTAKVTIKPRKGWKVSKLRYTAWYEGDDEELMENGDISKSYKNNAVITFRNSDDYSEWISFTMTEKSTGFRLNYQIDLSRR